MAWAKSVDTAETFFLCRFSQLSVLRLLTNRGAMGAEAMTEIDAWRAFDRLITYWGAVLLDEPTELERLFRERTRRREISTKRWADGYLTAFAEGHELSFVTFDRALAKETARAVLLAV